MRLALAVTIALLTAGTAHAAHPSQPDYKKVGIGLTADLGSSLSLFDLYYSLYYGSSSPLSNTSIQVPIILTTGLRIEPAISLGRVVDDDDDVVSSQDLSVSVAPSWKIGKKASGYAGGRVGLARVSYTSGKTSDSASDKHIGGLIGSEVWLTNQLTFGAEASLNYTGYDSDNYFSSSLSTQGSFVFRFYLN